MGKEVDFIGRYQCPHDIVDQLVSYYHDNKELQTIGKQGGDSNQGANIDTKVKDSTDIYVDFHQARHISFIGQYEEHLGECTKNYIEQFPDVAKQHHWGITEFFNLQHYKVGGGFKEEHFERTGQLDKTIKRMLVFMTYLNDVPDGGTTFKYFEHTETAVKGKTLIWPSDWHHTHCGEISFTQEKMIATGWFSFIWDF